mmetsp:Transcript_60296/g.72478  ORF Transcript_60296/g.72478 Transcript_60296/m.72478 type:complete len:218 (+) Transcript_60296:1088-1741(+)
MLQTAVCIMVSASSTLSFPASRHFFHSGLSSTLHSCTFTATCVPSGLVSTTTSPTRAPSLCTNSPFATMEVATPPMIGQGFITVCPPLTVVPASSHASRNPRTISRVQISLTSFSISRHTASSISTKSHSPVPSAYKSERTFAAPIRPCRYGLSTSGKKKSVVEITKFPCRVSRTLQSNAIRPSRVPRFFPSPRFISRSICCRSVWETLQAHPFRSE